MSLGLFFFFFAPWLRNLQSESTRQQSIHLTPRHWLPSTGSVMTSTNGMRRLFLGFSSGVARYWCKSWPENRWVVAFSAAVQLRACDVIWHVRPRMLAARDNDKRGARLRSKRDVGRRHTFDPLIHPEWPRNSNGLTSLCTQIIILSNDYLSFNDVSDITYYWSTDGVIKDHLPRICLRLFMTVSPKLNARWRQISVSTVIPQQVERTWTCTRFPAREYQAVHLDWNTWLR